MAIKCLNQEIGDRFALYHGDCCEVLEGIPAASIGMSIFSPPFSDLYCYSDSERDMGNCRGMDEFFQQFGILVDQLARVMMPGRIIAVHCMDVPSMKERDGIIGLKDFPGDIIRCFTARGFVYHSRVAVWKDPLIEATRTKALGLMHKQLCKDSSMSRMGLPDYILAFRSAGENAVPIQQGEGLTRYAGGKDPGGIGVRRSHNIWRSYASPVWMDVRQTFTLNRKDAREESDEKHVCPLQLDVIERAVTLWSNPGDVVLTPFMGVGSEVFGSLILGRRAIGIELKPSYYSQAVRNVQAAVNNLYDDPDDLFSLSEIGEPEVEQETCDDEEAVEVEVEGDL